MTDIWDEKPNTALPYDWLQWVKKLKAEWDEFGVDAYMWRSIEDIEIDLKQKLISWNREGEVPSLMAQNLLTVVAIDELMKRYINQGKKLEAVKKIVIENKGDDARYSGIHGDLLKVLGLTYDDLELDN